MAQNQQVVVVADTLSNLQGKGTITLHDHWLGREELHAVLAPDLVISFGKSIISKSLKLLLRKQDIQHWHIQPDGQSKDTYVGLSRILGSEPLEFLTWLTTYLPPLESDYVQLWQLLEKQVETILPKALKEVEFGEYPAVKQVLDTLPANGQLHGDSVREFFGETNTRNLLQPWHFRHRRKQQYGGGCKFDFPGASNLAHRRHGLFLRSKCLLA
uniref:hypothetical protein n=1 Tax=Algoriphagus sp. TaxID=1872435 RepID=UPI004048198C